MFAPLSIVEAVSLDVSNVPFFPEGSLSGSYVCGLVACIVFEDVSTLVPSFLSSVS